MEVGNESATMTDRELAASNSTSFSEVLAVDINSASRCSVPAVDDLAEWQGGVCGSDMLRFCKMNLAGLSVGIMTSIMDAR